MSWYRTGTVAVTNGSKTVTGVGTLFTTAVNAGDAFAIVDANLNPTGAWYEVESVTNNTTLVLKQSYAGSTGGNKQYAVFNLVGNMTTPSFAQRLATFFASFQSLIDKPTTTPTASSIPIAGANGLLHYNWLPAATTAAKGAVELATSAETLTGTDTARAVTPKALADTAFYRKGNILGTVSQSSGVPTGAVIERGSNTNGAYVKFADGTMICTVEFSNVSCDTASGSIYISDEISFTLPATFLSTPNISAHTGNLSWVLGFAGVTSTTNFSIKCARPVGPGTATRPTITAIGRWF